MLCKPILACNLDIRDPIRIWTEWWHTEISEQKCIIFVEQMVLTNAGWIGRG